MSQPDSPSDNAHQRLEGKSFIVAMIGGPFAFLAIIAGLGKYLWDADYPWLGLTAGVSAVVFLLWVVVLLDAFNRNKYLDWVSNLKQVELYRSLLQPVLGLLDGGLCKGIERELICNSFDQ